jgi:hypothetical protein
VAAPPWHAGWWAEASLEPREKPSKPTTCDIVTVRKKSICTVERMSLRRILRKCLRINANGLYIRSIV